MKDHPHNPCFKCKGLCCQYICLPLQAPETREDFDEFRWYLTHKGTHIWVEEGTWYLYMQAPCRHQTKDHKCDIYTKRPATCRQYKSSDCERSKVPFEYELLFTDDAQMEAYMKAKFDNLAQENRRRHAEPKKEER